MTSVALDSRIVIVGAGCFGISTAYHLLRRGYSNVTVLERSPVVPASDAASGDINKIVRSSYSDIFYARFAREAIAEWKKEEWGDAYRESGVLVLNANFTDAAASYTDDAYRNDLALGARVTALPNTAALRTSGLFPAEVQFAADGAAYVNYDGGWAHASAGVARMCARVEEMGGRVQKGVGVEGLVREGGRCVGVRMKDGEVWQAEVVVLAVGAWTAGLFPELGMEERCLATGQTLATIQLTEEEATLYRKCPVVLDFNTGFYVFPPNDGNIVKLAIHAAGYTNTASGVSTPRTIASHSADGLRIPTAAVHALRAHLRRVYPALGEKAFASTRLCWYTDAPDEDWVIGPHKEVQGVWLATAGSGHAFKFLPVIGRLVADSVEGKLDPLLVRKFAPDREIGQRELKTSRALSVTELKEEELCTPEDLLP